MKTRSYRMGARADAVRATRDRVLDSAYGGLLTRWYDELTINEIAAGAGVSSQTVVNHFGSKDALLLAVVDERVSPGIAAARAGAVPGDVTGIVTTLVDSHERVGDAIIRGLALEARVPGLRPALAKGRARHREWLARMFAQVLDPLEGTARDERLELLAAVTDVYVWKLQRRDRGLSRQRTAAVMETLVRGVLDTTTTSEAR